MKSKLSNISFFIVSLSLIGILTASPTLAAEKHHQQPQTAIQQPVAKAGGSQNSSMMGGSAMPSGTMSANSRQGMMGQSMMGGSRTGMGMMEADANAGMGMMGPGMMRGFKGGMGMMGSGAGGGMMRMMGSGMMRMMMSHMMGGPGGMRGMMGNMKRGMMNRMGVMLNQLNLTPDQWNKVRILARKRLEKMVDLWAQMTKLQIELSALRWDEKVGPKQIKELFVKRATVQAEMFLTSLTYLQGLKGILTPQQAKKLEGWNLQ